MVDFCLQHYLLLPDSEAMTLYKCHHSHTLFYKTFKGNISRFGFAIQVLPSDIGEYLSSFFNAIVVVILISIFIL